MLGIKPKEAPKYNYEASYIVHCFSIINRARVWSQHGAPMPLSSRDVLDYRELYGLDIESSFFADCIFSIDSEFMKEAFAELKRKK